MNDVEYFNSFGSNAVDNQVGIKDDVAVHAAFGSNMSAFGINGIEDGKRFNCFFYLMVITLSLKVTKSTQTIIIICERLS